MSTSVLSIVRTRRLSAALFLLILLISGSLAFAQNKNSNASDDQAKGLKNKTAQGDTKSKGEQDPGGQANPGQADKKVPLTIDRVFTVVPQKENVAVVAGIGDRIRVHIVGLAKAVETDNVDPHKFVLFLDGIELKGVTALPVDVTHGTLEFSLERSPDSRKAWDALLGSPQGAFKKNTTVSVQVTNTGKMNGEEVAELYVSNQNKNIHAPIKSLKGFQRIALKAGETKTVTFSLTADNLSIVNEDGKLYLPKGKLVISVGGGQPGVKNKTTSNVVNSITTVL